MKKYFLPIALALAIPTLQGSEISPSFKIVWSAASGQKPNEGTFPWQMSGGNGIKTGKGNDQLKDGFLILDTPRKDIIEGVPVVSRTYLISNTRFWNPAQAAGGTTIEFRMKVESVANGCSNAATFGFSTGEHSFRLAFDTAGLIAQKEYIDADTSELHTFRITLDAGSSTAHLYIDNAREAAATLEGSPSTIPPAIFFGSLFEASGGLSAWEYVAFTHSGVYTP